MKITVNGKPENVETNLTAQALLDRLGVVKNSIVFELNAQVIARDTFPQAVLREGDVVEIVQFVGGG